jgi:hypothetical protein
MNPSSDPQPDGWLNVAHRADLAPVPGSGSTYRERLDVRDVEYLDRELAAEGVTRSPPPTAPCAPPDVRPPSLEYVRGLALAAHRRAPRSIPTPGRPLGPTAAGTLLATAGHGAGPKVVIGTNCHA